MKSDNFLTEQHKANYEMYKDMYVEHWGWRFVTERVYYFSDGSERCRIFIVKAQAPEDISRTLIHDVRIITPFNIAEDGTVLEFHVDTIQRAMDILANMNDDAIFAMIKAEAQLEIIHDKIHGVLEECMKTG